MNVYPTKFTQFPTAKLSFFFFKVYNIDKQCLQINTGICFGKTNIISFKDNSAHAEMSHLLHFCWRSIIHCMKVLRHFTESLYTETRETPGKNNYFNEQNNKK